MLREKELALLENLKTDNARKTEEIQQLRNNQLIGQASGEEIVTITDGALAFANILEETEIEVEGAKRKAYVVKLPQGLSKQKVRQGYNSAKYDKETQTISEIKFTHNDDNSMKVNGTSTNYVTFKLNQEPITLKAGTYTLAVLYDKTIERGIDIHFDIRDNETSIENILKSIYMTTNANSWKTSEITLEKETDVNLVYYVTNGATVENQTVKFMLLEGTYTAENLPEYEEYGESPSIEFPSEIENVRAWNSINNIAQSTSNNGIDFIINEDKSITLNGTVTAKTYICLTNTNNDINNYTNKILTLKNKYYINPLGNNNLSYGIRNTSGEYKTLANSIGEDIGLIYINVAQGATFNNYTIYPMLINGSSEPKPYAPYGAISIGLGNKNKINLGDLEDTKLTVNVKYKNNKITLNGTTSNNGYLSQNAQYSIGKVKAGTYTFQFLTDKTYTYVQESSICQIYLVKYENNTRQAIYEQNLNNLNGKKTFTLEEEKELFIELYATKSGINFNNLVILLQLEENNEATEIIESQEQDYNLHLDDLELNGIGEIRDSFVVELDNSYSYKKVNKLYLKKKYNEKVFDTETLNNIDFIQLYTNTEKNIYQYRIRNFIADLLVNPDPFHVKDIALCNYKKKNGPNDNINNVLNDNLFTMSGNKEIVINSNKPTITDFKNELIELNNNGNPLKILYPLEEPKLIDLTDDYPELVKDLEYLINNFKTFKEVTHVEVDNGYIDLEYVKSTELALKNIQQQIDNISALMLEGGTGNA